jgi:ribose transport system substrate-binding protein
MAWHERGLTVVTSVVSGLIVAAVVKAVNSGIADGVVAGIMIRRRKRSARVFLMTSAFSQKYYLADFVQRVHMALDRNDIDLVLKVPDQDYDAAAQSHNLKRIEARQREYLGGIVIAAEMDRLRKDLTEFCRDTKLPVVFTDLEPYEQPDDYPENAAFVGYDTGELGDLAGEWLVRQLGNVDRPRVLIIASEEHSARQQRCKKALEAARTDVTVEIKDKCAFSRSRAHDAVRAYLRDLDRGQRLDAVFCTNDEMALGAVDALTPPSPATRTTVVIGVDGVLEVKALIDRGQGPLRATVVQDTQRLANSVVDALLKMRRGRAVRRPSPLSAKIYEA